MPKHEAPLSSLEEYIPAGSSQLVFEYLKHYKVHLTITRSRKTVLGDYRHAIGAKNHRISVNGTLNIYAFLITLIHELAHLIEASHNQRFWSLLDANPETERARGFLDGWSASRQAAGITD